MINKELRLAGFIIKLISGASVRRFKIMNALTRLLRGRELKNFQNQEWWVQRKKDGSRIRVRVYKPLKNDNPSHDKQSLDKKLPALLYLHGGGYVLGVPEIAHSQISGFLRTRDCVVIAPDYRKSVDHPYPAALDDAYDTLVWIKENADELGIRSDQIMVGGHSAGGGLTAATCLYARDQKEVNVAFQMPIYPMIDDRMTNPSATNNTAPLWDSKNNQIGWDLYLKALKEKGLPIPIYAAPSRSTDYTNLPPAITFVGDIEPFKDETVEYVDNLKKAGVAVKFEMYEGCYHGFETVVPKAKVSRAATQFLHEGFAYAVDNYFAEQY